MKKLLILFFSILALASCAPEKSADELKAELLELKQKRAKLDQKIKEIETKLDEDSLANGKTIVPVEVKELAIEKFVHSFIATGSVEAIDEAYISPETNGQVKKIYVKEGQRVKKGQLLVKLNTSITETSIEEVKTGLRLAETLYEKQKKLWKEQNIGTEMQYLESKNQVDQLKARLKTLEAQLELAYVRSPINGIVDKIYVKEGELATVGRQVMQVVNLSDLYVNAEISEAFLPSVHVGDEVILNFPAYPDMQFRTKIYQIGNVINPENRSFPIKLKVRNVKDKLKPNIVATIEISDFESDNAILVPAQIVKEDKTRAFLYVVEEKDGKFYAKKTTVYKVMAQNDVLMVDGLKEGDRVIVKGNNLVSDGSEIRLVGTQEEKEEE